MRAAPWESVSLFRLDSDGMMGCDELGMLAETDGALEVSANCSCARPAPPAGTEAGALERIKRSASNLGANAAWILKVHEQTGLITERECCSVTGFRAYAVAFHCDDSHLAWHQKHEDLAKP